MAVAKGLIILMVAGVDGVDNVVVVCRSESYLLSDIKSSARVLARDWEGPRSYRAPGFVAGQAGQGLLCHPTSRPAASTPSLRKSKMTLGQPRAHRIDEAAADQACLVRGREDDVVVPDARLASNNARNPVLLLATPTPTPTATFRRRGSGRSNGGHGYVSALRVRGHCPRARAESCARMQTCLQNARAKSRQGGVAASGDGSNEHRMD